MPLFAVWMVRGMEEARVTGSQRRSRLLHLHWAREGDQPGRVLTHPAQRRPSSSSTRTPDPLRSAALSLEPANSRLPALLE